VFSALEAQNTGCGITRSCRAAGKNYQLWWWVWLS
jgi:hypothetical protein